MKLTELIAVACAITAGSVAFNMMSRYMDSYRAQYREHMRDQYAQVAPEPAKPRAELTTVVTAQRSLTFGYQIRREDLKHTNWPADAVPEGAFRKIEDVFSGEQPPRVKLDVGAGEVLLHSKVNTTHQGSAISMLLPPGLRAVTIKINEIRGVAGFVRPSDRVDILLTEKSDNQDANLSTRVLLQNILVLGVDQDARLKNDQPRVANSMTVAVSLEEAQKLALASSVGFLSLALRHPLQPMVDRIREISLADLKLRAEKSSGGGGNSTIQVVRATKTADYTVPRTDQ
jgi:pilus assembly protein CpaB